MKRPYIFMIALSWFGTQTACKPGQSSDLRSLLGLEAGQDEAMRGSGADAFVALSDWFQTFRASAGGQAGSISSASFAKRSPSASVKLLEAYLLSQITRFDELKIALDRSDDKEIAKLLGRETLEMKDIALALISDSSSWQPSSGDKLAQLIIASRRHSSFADRFATKGFLEKVFAKSKAAQLLKDIEPQRQKYLTALLARYTGGSQQRAALRARLESSRKVLNSMLSSLDTQGGASLALTNTDTGTVDGAPAVLLSFMDEGESEAKKKKNDADQNNENASSNASTSDSPEAILEANPYSAIKAKNTAYKIFFEAAPPDLKNAVPEAGSSLALLALPQPVSSSGLERKTARATFVAAEEYAAITHPELSLTANKPTVPFAAEPSVDCTRLNLKGSTLVNCQRFLAYTIGNQQLRRTQGVALTDDTSADSSSSTSNSSSTSKVKSDTALIKAFIIHGSIDDKSGDVSQQGANPSCSQHAVHSVLRLNMRRLGLDPNDALLSSNDEINSLYYNSQGAVPMISSAFQAAKTYYSSKFKMTGRQVSWEEGRELLVKNARPLLVALNTSAEWMIDGGGAEFRSLYLDDAESGNTGTLRKFRCGDDNFGHAVIVVGFIGNDPIIKNSWGSDWAEGGLALVDGESCMNSNSANNVIYDVEVTKN